MVGANAIVAGQTQPPPGSPDARAEAEIRRLSAEEVQAFLQRDPGLLARLWSDDFVVTNPLNQLVTKAQVLEMVKSGVAAGRATREHRPLSSNR